MKRNSYSKAFLKAKKFTKKFDQINFIFVSYMRVAFHRISNVTYDRGLMLQVAGLVVSARLIKYKNIFIETR